MNYKELVYSCLKLLEAFVVYILNDPAEMTEISTLEPPEIIFWKVLYKEDLTRQVRKLGRSQSMNYGRKNSKQIL